jgi:hypothetical protein
VMAVGTPPPPVPGSHPMCYRHRCPDAGRSFTGQRPTWKGSRSGPITMVTVTTSKSPVVQSVLASAALL